MGDTPEGVFETDFFRGQVRSKLNELAGISEEMMLSTSCLERGGFFIFGSKNVFRRMLDAESLCRDVRSMLKDYPDRKASKETGGLMEVIDYWAERYTKVSRALMN